MRISSKLVAIGAGMVVAATPTVALAHHQPSSSSHGKAKEYGKLCQGESKKHVKGMKGTPFSQCVTAMAKLANGSSTNPNAACKAESKKHVKGMKGTPYSQCVKAGHKLLQETKGS